MNNVNTVKVSKQELIIAMVKLSFLKGASVVKLRNLSLKNGVTFDLERFYVKIESTTRYFDLK